MPIRLWRILRREGLGESLDRSGENGLQQRLHFQEGFNVWVQLLLLGDESG